MAAHDHLHPQLFSGYGRPEPATPAAPDKPGALPHLSNDEWERRGGNWGPTAHDGEQLPMFMSAKEIQTKYQPLDADRLGGPEDEDAHPNTTWSSSGGNNPTQYNKRGDVRRSFGGSKLYDRYPKLETDQELWNRKAEEAGEYGLHEEIMEHGVQKPVSLGQQFGNSGKPQVVGGHHRIAVMGEESPDELMPVLHFKSFGQARMQGANAEKGRGGWKYT
jgi:hypothetical protein